MHQGNRDWLAYLKALLPDYFKNARVLEIGSYDVNGTARDYFQEAIRYVGVDKVAGPGVDIVADAGATIFTPGEFDTLVYLSVFEHDPAWAENFAHNLTWIRPGGLLIVGWGAEGNKRHEPEPWAPVPHRAFLDRAGAWPIEILDAFFEEKRFVPDCPGAFDLLARKR